MYAFGKKSKKSENNYQTSKKNESSEISFAPEGGAISHDGEAAVNATYSNFSEAGVRNNITFPKKENNNRLDGMDAKGHFIWLGRQRIPGIAVSNIIDFKRKNPEFTVNLWTDNTKKIEDEIDFHGVSLAGFKNNVYIRDISTVYKCDEEVIESSFSPSRSVVLESAVIREMFGAYKNVAAASDLLRYAILAQEGGIYLDVDVYTRESMEEFIDMQEGILIHLAEQDNETFVSNAVIASEANGVYINEILNYALSPYDRNGKAPAFEIGEDSPLIFYFSQYGIKYSLKENDNSLNVMRNINKGLLTSAMYDTKRSLLTGRKILTLSVSGPKMLSNFIRANERKGIGKDELIFPDPDFFGQQGALNKADLTFAHNPELNDNGHWTKVRGRRRANSADSVLPNELVLLSELKSKGEPEYPTSSHSENAPYTYSRVPSSSKKTPQETRVDELNKITLKRTSSMTSFSSSLSDKR